MVEKRSQEVFRVHDDPFETRDRGLRRVRAVTASVAAASLLGTGVIVYEFAHPATANAQQTVQGGSGQQGGQQVVPDGPVQGPSDDNGFGDDGGGGGQLNGGQSGQGGFQPPAQLPAPAPQIQPHASSGGS